MTFPSYHIHACRGRSYAVSPVYLFKRALASGQDVHRTRCRSLPLGGGTGVRLTPLIWVGGLTPLPLCIGFHLPWTNNRERRISPSPAPGFVTWRWLWPDWSINLTNPGFFKHKKSLTWYYISKAIASAQPIQGALMLTLFLEKGEGLIKELLSPFACWEMPPSWVKSSF